MHASSRCFTPDDPRIVTLVASVDSSRAAINADLSYARIRDLTYEDTRSFRETRALMSQRSSVCG